MNHKLLIAGLVICSVGVITGLDLLLYIGSIIVGYLSISYVIAVVKKLDMFTKDIAKKI